MANIENFKANLTGGGARANQFEVTMNFPSLVGSEATRPFTYLCQATSLPASTMGTTEVSYRGRKMYLAGDRTYEDWTTTVLNDTDFKIRKATESWINVMDSPLFEASTATSPALYKTSASVKQLDRNGAELAIYTFHGIMPTTVASIGLDYSSNDEIETFDVTWKFDYFTVA